MMKRLKASLMLVLVVIGTIGSSLLALGESGTSVVEAAPVATPAVLPSAWNNVSMDPKEFDSSANFTPYGSTTVDTANEIVSLTPAAANNIGYYNLNNKLSLAHPFTLKLYVKAGSEGAENGVGITWHTGETSDINATGVSSPETMGTVGFKNAITYKLDPHKNKATDLTTYIDNVTLAHEAAGVQGFQAYLMTNANGDFVRTAEVSTAKEPSTEDYIRFTKKGTDAENNFTYVKPTDVLPVTSTKQDPSIVPWQTGFYNKDNPVGDMSVIDWHPITITYDPNEQGGTLKTTYMKASHLAESYSIIARNVRDYYARQLHTDYLSMSISGASGVKIDNANSKTSEQVMMDTPKYKLTNTDLTEYVAADWTKTQPFNYSLPIVYQIQAYKKANDTVVVPTTMDQFTQSKFGDVLIKDAQSNPYTITKLNDKQLFNAAGDPFWYFMDLTSLINALPEAPYGYVKPTVASFETIGTNQHPVTVPLYKKDNYPNDTAFVPYDPQKLTVTVKHVLDDGNNTPITADINGVKVSDATVDGLFDSTVTIPKLNITGYTANPSNPTTYKIVKDKNDGQNVVYLKYSLNNVQYKLQGYKDGTDPTNVANQLGQPITGLSGKPGTVISQTDINRVQYPNYLIKDGFIGTIPQINNGIVYVPMVQQVGKLTLIAKGDDGSLFENATFKIVDAKGNAVTTDASGNPLPALTTDANGQIVLPNMLLDQAYTVTEMSVPSGWDVTGHLQSTTLTLTAKEKTLTFISTKQMTATYPNTGGSGQLKLLASAIAILMMGIISFAVHFFKNMRKHRA